MSEIDGDFLFPPKKICDVLGPYRRGVVNTRSLPSIFGRRTVFPDGHIAPLQKRVAPFFTIYLIGSVRYPIKGVGFFLDGWGTCLDH